MIYFISDLHGDKDFPGLLEYLKVATKDDLLIILGDVGLNFKEADGYLEFMEFFLSIDKNIAFIDGNHENFDYLESFPEEDWCGGKVRRLTPSIVLMKRGSVFDINGKTFFTFGGCKSSAKWKDMGLWYAAEEPTDDELALACETLRSHGNIVDYILTHRYFRERADGVIAERLEELVRYIDRNVEFGHWYSGHWHRACEIDAKHTVIYNELTKIK